MTLRFHIISYALGLLTALLLVGTTVYFLRQPDPPPIALHLPPTPAPSPTAPPTPTPAPLVIFVSGAVLQPGLYTLPWGSRVGDAITAAGGLAANADPASINQAQSLVDGAQLYIPPPTPPDAQTQLTPAPPPAGLSGILPTPSPPNPAAPPAAGSNLINLNTATLAELDILPGIGPTRAQAIIDGRPYQSVSDLERVPGIGAATLTRLQPLVTVDP